MTNYSTLGHNLKRGVFCFCGKISGVFYRPVQKFIAEMVYGLLAARNVLLRLFRLHLRWRKALLLKCSFSRNPISFPARKLLSFG